MHPGRRIPSPATTIGVTTRLVIARPAIDVAPVRYLCPPMKNRDRRSLLLLAIAATAGLSLDCAEPTRPNIVLVTIDDLNDWVGSMRGHPAAATPNIDQLARRGLRFDNAHVAAPVCNPSRTAVMTGRRPHRTGVYFNPQPWRGAMPDVVTLPQYFREHGYYAFGGGKIYHGKYEEPDAWDEWFASGRAPPTAPEDRRGPYRHKDRLVWSALRDLPADAMPDQRTATWASEILRREHAKPFFMAVGFKKPHPPWQVPEHHFRALSVEDVALPEIPADDLDDVPPAGRALVRTEHDHAAIVATGTWREAVRAYLASIRFVDEQVGRVIAALDAGPNARNTVVVVWSDHGWHLGEKQHWRKATLWEEATRIPLIVVAPGTTEPGSVTNAPVDTMSLFPTLIDLAGLPRADGIDGVSLRPLLEDPNAVWDTVALTTHSRGNHAVRSERWRYIRYEDGSEELYDHSVDPGEWNNLAADEEHAPLKRRLAAFLPDAHENAPNAAFDNERGPPK